MYNHLKYMVQVIKNSRRVISGTTLGELYNSYIELEIALIKTYALLDEAPGKKLTEKNHC